MNIFRNRHLLLYFTLVIGLLLFSQCNDPKPEEGQEKEVIKIGAVLPLTGSLSKMGNVERNAMELASNNADIQLLVEDSKGTQAGAAAAANKLINIENVDVIISSTTGASLTISPIASQNEINHIAFCMDPSVSETSVYTSRFYPGVDDEAEPIINYFNNFQNSNIAILKVKVASIQKVVEDVYVPELTSLGGDIVFNEEYEIGETDFKNLILKLKSSKADYLILLGYGFQYPFIFRELQSVNLLESIQIIGGWGFLYTDVEKSLLDDVLVSGPEYVFENTHLAEDFSTKYQAVYSSYPNFDAAFAYNTIDVLSRIEKDEYDAPIKPKLNSISNKSSIVGLLNFNNSGELIVPAALGVIKDGRIVKID